MTKFLNFNYLDGPSFPGRAFSVNPV